MNSIDFQGASTFQITFKFMVENRETELAMLIDGENILAFERCGHLLTTRWNLDELVMWLRDFLDNMADEPYPVDAEEEFAAQKDISACKFDTDDNEAFDAYYDKLDEWNTLHRWHPASGGAVLSDLYFQQSRENVEFHGTIKNLKTASRLPMYSAVFVFAKNSLYSR